MLKYHSCCATFKRAKLYHWNSVALHFTLVATVILVFSQSILLWSKLSANTNQKSTQTYFEQYMQDSCQLYFEFGGRVHKGVNNVSGQLLGGIDGQKAVCLDAGVAPPPGFCVVYSFGISDDWSFDKAMEAYGCDVYSFDPSVNDQTKPNSSKRLHFFSLGLGPWNIRNDVRGTFNHVQINLLRTVSMI